MAHFASLEPKCHAAVYAFHGISTRLCTVLPYLFPVPDADSVRLSINNAEQCVVSIQRWYRHALRRQKFRELVTQSLESRITLHDGVRVEV